MSTEFERRPLPVESFPPNLQMHIKADAPPPMKMMAARGMVPAPPAQMVQILYQLHFDSALSKDVTQALLEMPENILVPALQQAQPPPVLDWIAEVRQDRAAQQAILLNGSTEDATFIHLAATVDGELCEIIANNQVRVLRSPQIIEALYTNPKTRMSTVDKLIDLARRNEVDLSGLQGLAMALESGESLNESPGLDEDAFGALLGEEAQRAELDASKLAQLDDKNLTRSQREALRRELGQDKDEDAADGSSPEEPTRGGNLSHQISQMNIAQKIRMATVGSREAIMLLVRDANKLVHMAAIRSPRVQIGDVRSMAANKSLPEGVISYIASVRDWTRHYEVMTNLVMNPKTPLSDAISFMNHLRMRELRLLSRDRNVPHQVTRQARQLLQKRGQR